MLMLGVGGSKRDSTVSGLKSSSRQNKASIDAAVCHTVSKCLEKPLRESEPPPGAVLCAPGSRRQHRALRVLGAWRTKRCRVSSTRDARKLVSLSAGGGQTVFHQGSDIGAF